MLAGFKSRVDESSSMRGVQPCGDLSCDVDRVTDRKPTVAAESRPKRFSIVQRQRHEQPAVLARAELVNGAEVRVVEHGDRIGLAQETRSGRAIEVVMGQQELERDRTTLARVVGSIDDAHASRPERLMEMEMRDGATGEAERIGSTRRPDFFPASRVHRSGSSLSSSASHARAKRSSRLAVARDTPVAAALSSSVRPPK